MSTTHDPATPYAGAKAMTRQLARARLLTVDGYGHGEPPNRAPAPTAMWIAS
jgi:hypothetical protein